MDEENERILKRWIYYTLFVLATKSIIYSPMRLFDKVYFIISRGCWSDKYHSVDKAETKNSIYALLVSCMRRLEKEGFLEITLSGYFKLTARGQKLLGKLRERLDLDGEVIRSLEEKYSLYKRIQKEVEETFNKKDIEALEF